MKLLFASDIHGDSESCEFIIEKFHGFGAEKLVLAGDLLYHGPRNDLPAGYNPKKVIELLNSVKDKIVTVRGNCDAEVDQMVLEFPITAPYQCFSLDGVDVFLTHGHVYDMESIPASFSDGVFIQGHTHIPVCEKKDNLLLLNPGSCAIPKGGFKKSYMTYDNGIFTILDFDGNVIFKSGDVR